MSKVDFLPDNYVQKRVQRRIRAICWGLSLLVVAGVASGLAVTEHRRRKLDQYAQQIRSKVTQAQESLKQLDAVEARRKEVWAKARTSASLVDPLPQSLVIAMITNHLPEGAVLVDYDMRTKQISSHSTETQKTKSRNKRLRQPVKDTAALANTPPKLQTTFDMMGMAGSDLAVAQFVANLNSAPLIEQVNLRFSKEFESDGVLVRSFMVSAALRGDVPSVPAAVLQAGPANLESAFKSSTVSLGLHEAELVPEDTEVEKHKGAIQ